MFIDSKFNVGKEIGVMGKSLVPRGAGRVADYQSDEKDRIILRLRSRGLTLRAIAAQVGISHQAVSQRIQKRMKWLAANMVDDTLFVRNQIQLRQHDQLRMAYDLWDKAGDDPKAVKAASDMISKVNDQLMNMYGLDTPDVLVNVGDNNTLTILGHNEPLFTESPVIEAEVIEVGDE